MVAKMSDEVNMDALIAAYAKKDLPRTMHKMNVCVVVDCLEDLLELNRCFEEAGVPGFCNPDGVYENWVWDTKNGMLAEEFCEGLCVDWRPGGPGWDRPKYFRKLGRKIFRFTDLFQHETPDIGELF